MSKNFFDLWTLEILLISLFRVLELTSMDEDKWAHWCCLCYILFPFILVQCHWTWGTACTWVCPKARSILQMTVHSNQNSKCDGDVCHCNSLCHCHICWEKLQHKEASYSWWPCWITPNFPVMMICILCMIMSLSGRKMAAMSWWVISPYKFWLLDGWLLYIYRTKKPKTTNIDAQPSIIFFFFFFLKPPWKNPEMWQHRNLQSRTSKVN